MANQTSPQTASGRVRTNSPLSADPYRYQFLNLPNAEPNLSIPALVGSNNTTKYTVLSDPISGVRTWSNNSIAVLNNKVGFGTDTPNEKVTVVGNISATGTIYGTIFNPVVPGAAGSNNQVQFNGNGTLSADQGFTYNPILSALIVGYNNSTIGSQASIAGGKNNSIIGGNLSFIGGGDTNQNLGSTGGFIGAGKQNLISGDYSIIVGGRQNQTGDVYAVNVGGYLNQSNALGGVVVGGQNNQTVSGTQNNGILGGQNNYVQHNNSFAIGSNITTLSANYTYVNNLETLGQTIIDASVAERYTTLVPIASVVNIDLTQGTTANITLTSNVSYFTVSNYIFNKVNSFTIFVKQDNVGGHLVNFVFFGLTLKWNNGNIPLVTLSANCVDAYTFITNDGGSTWYGFVAAQNLK